MKYLSAILFLLINHSVQAQSTAEVVQALADSFRQAYEVPGIAVSLVRLDTIYEAYSGTQQMGSTRAVDASSAFHLASNTKALTSMLAAYMVESGSLQWNSTLQEVMPALNADIHPAYKSLTLESLLSNRAMIHPFEEDNSKEWKRMPPNLSATPDSRMRFAQYALGLPPAKIKKGNHLYSNGGFIIAGLMLEQSSGKTWEALMQEFFSSMNLAIAFEFPSQSDPEGNFGHRKKGNQYRPVAPSDEYPLGAYFAPAGNSAMNLPDLSRVVQLHLQGLSGQDNILQAKTYRHLHYGLDSYSLGWYNGYIGESEERFSYHGGSLGTFSSAIMLSAERQTGIIILVNADNEQVNDLKNELRKAIWSRYGQAP